jgi:hypothetical protein
VTDLKARIVQILAAEPVAVAAAAAKIRDTAAEVRDLCSGLGGVVSGNDWESASRDAYVQAADAKVELGAQMIAVMGGIADSVDSYAAVLAAAQARGRQAQQLWAQADRARVIAAGAVPPAAGLAALQQAEALNRAADQVAAATVAGLDQGAQVLRDTLDQYGSTLHDASGAINWGATLSSPLYLPAGVVSGLADAAVGLTTLAVGWASPREQDRQASVAGWQGLGRLLHIGANDQETGQAWTGMISGLTGWDHISEGFKKGDLRQVFFGVGRGGSSLVPVPKITKTARSAVNAIGDAKAAWTGKIRPELLNPGLHPLIPETLTPHRLQYPTANSVNALAREYAEHTANQAGISAKKMPSVVGVAVNEAGQTAYVRSGGHPPLVPQTLTDAVRGTTPAEFSHPWSGKCVEVKLRNEFTSRGWSSEGMTVSTYGIQKAPMIDGVRVGPNTVHPVGPCLTCSFQQATRGPGGVPHTFWEVENVSAPSANGNFSTWESRGYGNPWKLKRAPAVP